MLILHFIRCVVYEALAEASFECPGGPADDYAHFFSRKAKPTIPAAK